MSHRVMPSFPGASELRALIVEDNALVRMDLEDMLVSLGFASVRAASTPNKALDILVRERIDVAILDFSLEGATSLPVAGELADREIPFLFMSGYGPDLNLPERYRCVPICSKPFSLPTLLEFLTLLMKKPSAVLATHQPPA